MNLIIHAFTTPYCSATAIDAAIVLLVLGVPYCIYHFGRGFISGIREGYLKGWEDGAEDL